jgi:hypothetical protein
MLRAYVGIVSPHGLAALHPERDDTLCLVERWVQTDRWRVGFWAVLGDADAGSVQALCRSGRRREAFLLLDRCARDIGRILPDDPRPAPLH